MGISGVVGIPPCPRDGVACVQGVRSKENVVVKVHDMDDMAESKYYVDVKVGFLVEFMNRICRADLCP